MAPGNLLGDIFVLVYQARHFVQGKIEIAVIVQVADDRLGDAQLRFV